MRQDTCITSLENLKKWFDMNQKGKDGAQPYFTIWRGPESKADRIIYRNSEITDPDDAWNAMEDVLEMHSDTGGFFRIFITTKPAFNVGMSTIVRLNNPNPYAAQQTGIGGIGQGAYGIHGSVKDLVQSEVDRALEIERLRVRLENMEDTQKAGIGMTERLVEEFLPVMKHLVQAAGMKYMGYGPGSPSAGHPAPQMNGDEMPAGVEEFEYDYERIDPALDQLREVVPDIETALEKLAEMARKNPEAARTFLQNLG